MSAFLEVLLEDQGATVAFLTDPASYGGHIANVVKIDTHISVIALVGKRAFKLKRAVCLPYLDFSTAARRLAACKKELELNRRTAAALYIAVRTITREADGQLVFDGHGELVDAVVEMVRFDQNMLFDKLLMRGQLTTGLATELAHVIAHFHATTTIEHRCQGAANMASVLRINEQSLATTHIFGLGDIATLNLALRRTFDNYKADLDARGQAGKIRRCHGDLHLSNICLMNGVPTLFDCIEFNDAIATIDVLYDLAFLVMDLWRYGREPLANLILNRYLDDCNETGGLPLIPFFMALRAVVRAHVMATQALMAQEGSQEEHISEAKCFFDLALRLLSPVPARLVAIGGLSGTGKSTVAAAIADRIGPAPGARVLASDRIRKHIHGVSAETPLPEEAYKAEASKQVYAALARDARSILANGHGVIADAVFLQKEDRERIEQSALDAGVPFTGLWLEAQPAKLFARVDARHGDISDATLDVVRLQLAQAKSPNSWIHIQADDDVEVIVERVFRALNHR